jgi:hypothetical protein
MRGFPIKGFDIRDSPKTDYSIRCYPIHSRGFSKGGYAKRGYTIGGYPIRGCPIGDYPVRGCPREGYPKRD